MELNRVYLKKAENEFGVDREDIVSILKIETLLAKNNGDYRVFNSLVSRCLSEKRRNRRRFFYNELITFLSLVINGIKDPYVLKGSNSGAFGFSQFMPTTFETDFIDFDGDGRRDPYDIDDTIGSIAKLLNENGYQRNKRRAIRWYNRKNWYVNLVTRYSNELKKRSVETSI